MQCSADSTCGMCMEGYSVLGGACECTHGACMCNYTQSYNPATDQCVDNCGIEHCISCPANGGYCEECSGNRTYTYPFGCTLCQVEQCAFCQYDNNCSECNPGYSPMKGGCFKCEMEGCTNCMLNGSCFGCEGNYSFINGTCYPCYRQLQSVRHSGAVHVLLGW